MFDAAMRTPLLSLLSLAVVTALQAQNAAVTINVDATANRRPINPEIYGVAFATTAQLNDLNAPLNRSGGNGETRYNWQANGSNRANDYFYESIGETSATAGELGDTFISNTKAAGAQPMLTIPIMGWVAKLGPNRSKLASFSVAKYGQQQKTDVWMPDAGNGLHTDGSEITGNDPNDANMQVDSTFQQAWVQHIVTTWGKASAGGLRYYLLDNEHSIWHSSHRDVHPVGASMDETWTKMRDHAIKIKAVDSGAVVAGPEEWGWSGFFFSGYDQQYSAAHNWCCFPDRDAHGGADYAPWLLRQFRDYEVWNGTRLLDVFSLHYYPQGGEFSGEYSDLSSTMQLKRNRSTRALWDPSYSDESWISDTVRLIPRMREWVDANYPGTRIALTEYNWGAEEHINGATTEADILGIFGREGLDLATRWTTPDATTPTYKAIKMYRNYDGAKSTFGDISVSASGPNPDVVSAFAAVRSSDKALTVMIVSKALTGTTPATINVAHYTTSGTAVHQWQLTSANAITHPADATLSGTSLALTLPPQSITLLVIPGTTDTNAPSITLAPAVSTAADGTMTFSGTASDDVALNRVAWSMSGATTGSGNAAGTSSWTAGLHFNRGLTTVTFSAYDSSGNNRAVRQVVNIGAAVPGNATPSRRRAIGH